MMAKRTDFNGSNTQKRSKSPCSFHSFEPILSKRAKKKSPENPLVYWTFWRRVRDSNPRFLVGTQHFECCTFDLSDNSPCVYFNPLFSSLKFRSKNFWREKQERTLKNIRFLILKTLINGGFPADETTNFIKNFESCPL